MLGKFINLGRRVGQRLVTNSRNFSRLIRFTAREKAGTGEGPIVFFEIADPRLERYLYLLLKFFEIAGFTIYLKFNLNLLLNLRNYSELILRLENFRIFLSEPSGSFMHLTFDSASNDSSVGITPKYFGYPGGKPEEFIMPYPMHPIVYESGMHKAIHNFRKRERHIKVFFSGNTNEAYANPDIGECYDKVDRCRITQHLSELLDEEYLKVVSTIGQTVDVTSFETRGLLMFRNIVVDLEFWIKMLSNSEYVICPPGVSMPFSHNVIEAMAVGCIPILEYPEMFNPPLEDGVNCIAFSGTTNLCDRIREIVNQRRPSLTMRREAIKYYEAHLEPGAVIAELVRRLPELKLIRVNAEHLSLDELKKEKSPNRWSITNR